MVIYITIFAILKILLIEKYKLYDACLIYIWYDKVGGRFLYFSRQFSTLNNIAHQNNTYLVHTHHCDPRISFKLHIKS